MKRKLFQQLFLGCTLIAFFGSCVKDAYTGKETLNSGKTFVWITEAPVNNQFFDVFTNVKPVTMFTVRRDAANSADLNKAVTVSVAALPSSYIDSYNTANGTGYTLLPSSIYTVSTSGGVSVSATGLTLNFAAGDFAKNVVFNIDGSKVDLSKQYAAAFVITNHGGFSGKIGSDTVFATVAIKNKWDGVYAATGTMTDVGNSTLTHINDYLTTKGQAPMQYELRTISATQCVLFDNYVVGSVDIPITSGGTGVSYYGSFGLVLTFDPATNAITSVVNYYGQPAGNGRSARLDVTSPNAYDPTSKTIQIGYQLVGGSLSGGGVRTTWHETWKYLKSR